MGLGSREFTTTNCWGTSWKRNHVTFSLAAQCADCHSSFKFGSTLYPLQNRVSSEGESDSRSELIRKLGPCEPQGGDHRGTVGAFHYHVRVHLRHSVFEGDVANERKQFHLFVENAGWIVLFRCQVEPAQLRIRKRADGFKATPQPWCLENCCSTLAISSPVSTTRAKTFGSSSICFHLM
jgi:hypothetical protein